jgi:hypothetical protein
LRIKLTVILLICCLTILNAQVEYEKGYFIDANNKKTECLIKNASWKNNPTEFTYKLSENSATLVAKVSNVTEFGVENSIKYFGADVQIDRTGNELSQLNFNRNPEWENERLFLKVLIEGTATLLIYNDANLQRFFLRKENTIRQLVYKKYLAENNESRENNAFRQQLSMDVNCGDVNENSLKEVDYKTTALVNYFKKFNECTDGKFTDYTLKKNKGSLNLKIAPGIQIASVNIYDGYNTKNNKSGQLNGSLNFRLGLEMEYVLPFNKNKWGFIVEPSYQSSEASGEIGGSTLTVDYNSIEIAVGIRYRMYLNQHSNIFMNGFTGPSFPVNSKIDLKQPSPYNASPSANVSFGIGYNIKKISAEIRYYKNKDIMNEYLYWTTGYERLSFILSYKLMN